MLKIGYFDFSEMVKKLLILECQHLLSFVLSPSDIFMKTFQEMLCGGSDHKGHAVNGAQC